LQRAHFIRVGATLAVAPADAARQPISHAPGVGGDREGRPYAKIFASTEIFSFGRYLSEKRAFSVKFFTKSASKILYFATLRIFF
jgi:hypothetical protein